MKKLQLTKAEQQLAVEDIKSYFLTEKEEVITDLAAVLFLDFILENIGPLIYNQAVKDARFFMVEKLDDLFALEKPLRKSFPLNKNP